MTMLPWNADDLTLDVARFSGATRLFPLPDLVMYPHVMQPLHIFEARYRAMLNEALDSDGLLAMCVLDAGWEGDYEGRPKLFEYGCLGKVVTHHRLDDGTYNLMLLGLRRVRIVEEMEPRRPFREAKVELLEDVYLPQYERKRLRLQEQLSAAFQRALPEDAAPSESLQELLASKAPLGVLTDLVSFALPLDPVLKCELLKERNVDRRARRLLDALGEPASPQAASGAKTLPSQSPFSRN